MIANSHINRTLFVSIALLFICFNILMWLWVYIFVSQQEKLFRNKLYPNVYIDNILVGGKNKNEVIKIFEKRENNLKQITLFVTYRNSPIATFSAQTINIRTNVNEMYDQAFLVGRTPHYPSKIFQQLVTLLNLQSFRFNSQIQYDANGLKDSISQITDGYNIPAKNALFKFENNKVVSFQKEEAGVRVLSRELLKNIDSYIKSLKYKTQNYTFTLNETPIKPDITLGQTNSFGIEELIGEGISNYTHSIPTRIHNVILGASKLNGILIPKGKTFSFNETIGDISAATGYQPAYIIKEGKTVLGDGGGICQVSTTLFRAALNTGLPITQRFAHAYRVSYYENDSKPGLDATVFAPSVDLQFINDTPAAILIQTRVDEENMLLYFKLYGKKDNRNAEISTPIVFDVSAPPPDVRQDDPTLKRGVVKQVDFPAWGAKASFNYKVTRNNQVIFEKKFLSVYKPWAAVYLVGIQD